MLRSSDIPNTASVMVDRAPELELLNSAVAKARSGIPTLALIIGDNGTGKSFLVENFLHIAQQDWQDLVTAPSSGDPLAGRASSFQPIREVLEHLLGITESRGGAISPSPACPALDNLRHTLLSTFVTEPRSPLLALLSPPRLDILQRYLVSEPVIKEWLKDQPFRSGTIDDSRIILKSAAALLRSAPSGLALVLDDIQWVDSASLRLFLGLQRELSGRPVMLLATARTDGDASVSLPGDMTVSELSATVARNQQNLVIDLNEIRHKRGRHFCTELLSVRGFDASPESVDHLWTLTGANALFARDVLDLMPRTRLSSENGVTSSLPLLVPWDQLPRNHADALRNRMAGLTSEATKIIETASVEGQDFTAEVIALIHNMDLLTVLEILELELGRQHRFVEDVSASDVSFHNSTLSKFKFSHGYYQHLIYETRVGASRRRELHRRVGSALEQLWKGSEEAIGIQLAHHFELAGEAERAIKYYVLATQRGLALADFEAAALCAETGLRIAQQGVSAESENDVNSLYVAGATAARVRGDFRGAERIAREGLAHSAEGPLLIRLKLKSELARSLYNLDSNFAESESELRQAIALANELKDRRVGADLFRQLGIVFQRQGQFLDALEQYLTSLDSVEADLELMVTADAINAIGVAFALLGRAETAITFHNSALQLAGAQKNRSRDTLFLNDSCSPLRRLGRLEQVTDVTERSFRLAKDQGKIGALARAQYERAQVHRVQRKWREYGVALQDVLAHGSQLGTQSPQLRKARGELLLLSSLEPGLKLNLRVADELSALGEPGVTGTTEMHSVDYVSAILNYQSQDMANSLVHFRNVVEQITKMPGEPCWAWPFLRSLALFGISAITVSDESANTYKAAVKHLHRALAQFGETGVWHDVEFWGMVLSHVCGVTWPDVNSFITTGGSVVSESVTLLESRSLAELSRLTSLVPNLRAL